MFWGNRQPAPGKIGGLERTSHRAAAAGENGLFHGLDAGERHMGGAQQRVTHAVALDDLVGLVEQRVGRVGHGPGSERDEGRPRAVAGTKSVAPRQSR